MAIRLYQRGRRLDLALLHNLRLRGRHRGCHMIFIIITPILPTTEPGSEPFGITTVIDATPPASMRSIAVVRDCESYLFSKKPNYAHRITKNNDYN